MHINPPSELGVNDNPNNQNGKNIQKKRDDYDQLAKDIAIDGITEVKRDKDFDE